MNVSHNLKLLLITLFVFLYSCSDDSENGESEKEYIDPTSEEEQIDLLPDYNKIGWRELVKAKEAESLPTHFGKGYGLEYEYSENSVMNGRCTKEGRHYWVSGGTFDWFNYSVRFVENLSELHVILKNSAVASTEKVNKLQKIFNSFNPLNRDEKLMLIQASRPIAGKFVINKKLALRYQKLLKDNEAQFYKVCGLAFIDSVSLVDEKISFFFVRDRSDGQKNLEKLTELVLNQYEINMKGENTEQNFLEFLSKFKNYSELDDLDLLPYDNKEGRVDFNSFEDMVENPGANLEYRYTIHPYETKEVPSYFYKISTRVYFLSSLKDKLEYYLRIAEFSRSKIKELDQRPWEDYNVLGASLFLELVKELKDNPRKDETLNNFNQYLNTQTEIMKKEDWYKVEESYLYENMIKNIKEANKILSLTKELIHQCHDFFGSEDSKKTCLGIDVENKLSPTGKTLEWNSGLVVELFKDTKTVPLEYTVYERVYNDKTHHRNDSDVTTRKYYKEIVCLEKLTASELTCENGYYISNPSVEDTGESCKESITWKQVDYTCKKWGQPKVPAVWNTRKFRLEIDKIDFINHKSYFVSYR